VTVLELREELHGGQIERLAVVGGEDLRQVLLIAGVEVEFGDRLPVAEIALDGGVDLRGHPHSLLKRQLVRESRLGEGGRSGAKNQRAANRESTRETHGEPSWKRERRESPPLIRWSLRRRATKRFTSSSFPQPAPRRGGSPAFWRGSRSPGGSTPESGRSSAR